MIHQTMSHVNTTREHPPFRSIVRSPGRVRRWLTEHFGFPAWEDVQIARQTIDYVLRHGLPEPAHQGNDVCVWSLEPGTVIGVFPDGAWYVFTRSHAVTRRDISFPYRHLASELTFLLLEEALDQSAS